MKKEDIYEEYTIDEASFLWFDIDPYNPEGLTPEIKDKISAIRKRLEDAYLSGELYQNYISWRFDNLLTNSSNSNKPIKICWLSLKDYAIKIGKRPKFLFPEDIKEIRIKKSIFPCKKGTKWEDITITLIADDTVKIKTPQGEERYTYSELKLSDKRKGDAPTVIWNTLKYFLKNKGFISRHESDNEVYEYSNKLPVNLKRLNKHLQSLFDIKDSITNHYKKEKGYRGKFNCINGTYQHEARKIENKQNEVSSGKLKARDYSNYSADSNKEQEYINEDDASLNQWGVMINKL